MPGLLFPDMNTIPGVGSVLMNTENMFWWGRLEQQTFVGGMIVSTAADSSQAPTNYLRAGTLLARTRSTGKLTHWRTPAEGVEDGEDQIYGLLGIEQQMDQAGTNVDRFHGFIMVAGNVKASEIVIPGTSAKGIDGHAQEHLIRAQMAKRFIFDDDIPSADSTSLASGAPMGGFKNIAIRTADYTVLEADNGTLFHSFGDAGAIVYTLPAPKVGLHYAFSQMVDQNMTVNAVAANTISTFNDIDADGVVFSTPGNKIGAFVEFFGINSSMWLAVQRGPHTMTVTP